MKQYLVKINSGRGAIMNIVINTDSNKPVYIYYCGMDTGARYSRIGNAARELEKIAAAWGSGTIKTYGTIPAIPVKGCNVNPLAK